MSIGKWIAIIAFAVLAMVLNSCGDKSSDSNQPAPGKITASASGIVAQNGNTFAVMAYDYDWQPGATELAIAGVMGIINSNPYSFSSVLYAADTLGMPTNAERVFDPAIYSVVFFISAPGMPPQHYVEVRSAVNGNITVPAPTWANWIHP